MALDTYVWVYSTGGISKNTTNIPKIQFWSFSVTLNQSQYVLLPSLHCQVVQGICFTMHMTMTITESRNKSKRCDNTQIWIWIIHKNAKHEKHLNYANIIKNVLFADDELWEEVEDVGESGAFMSVWLFGLEDSAVTKIHSHTHK